jgi:hypothetical protein
MKILEIIKKIVIGVLGVVFFGFAIAMTVLLLNYNDYGELWGKSCRILGSSLARRYHRGC